MADRRGMVSERNKIFCRPILVILRLQISTKIKPTSLLIRTTMTIYFSSRYPLMVSVHKILSGFIICVTGYVSSYVMQMHQICCIVR